MPINFNYLFEQYGKCESTRFFNILKEYKDEKLQFPYQDLNDADNIYYAIFRVWAWDTLFQTNISHDALATNVGHLYKGYAQDEFVKIIKEILYCSGKEPAKQIINHAIQNCEVICDLFYKEEIVVLEDCKKTEDYSKILKHEKEYPREFVLAAKFLNSKKEKQPFLEIEEVLHYYGNSRIINVDEIKILKKEINGISFLYSGYAYDNIGFQNVIDAFIANFDRQGDNKYIQKSPVSFSLLKELQKTGLKFKNKSDIDYLLHVHENSSTCNDILDSDSIIASYSFFEFIAQIFDNSISLCKISFPSFDEFIVSVDDDSIFWSTSIDEKSATVISSRGVYNLNKSLFAKCRLSLQTC